MHQMTDFDGEMFMIEVRLLAGCKNLVHDTIRWLNAISQFAKRPTFFLTHTVYILFTALLYIVLI